MFIGVHPGTGLVLRQELFEDLRAGNAWRQAPFGDIRAGKVWPIGGRGGGAWDFVY